MSYIFKRVVKEYGSLMLFSVAILTYALADSVGGSGGLAVAVCGLVACNFSLSKRDEKEGLIQFQDQLSEMLRISVFTMLGAQATLLFGLQDFALIIVFFIIAVAIRPIFLVTVMGKVRRNFSRRDVILMSLIAPRGVSAAAMIPIIATAVISTGQPQLAEKMVNIVFMFVLLSVAFSSVVAKIGGMKRFDGYHEHAVKEGESQGPPDESVNGIVKKEDYADISLMLEREKEKKKGKKG
jgi:NhaP-type Na+/H+ or K+/H+ antiporter